MEPTGRTTGPRLPTGSVRASIAAADEALGKPCDLDRLVTIVGSRSVSDLPIHHPDVSKVHCALINTGAAIVIADLCSRLGTFVNDRRITTGVLRPGDRLRAGSIEIRVIWKSVPKRPERRELADQMALQLPTPIILEGEAGKYELTRMPAIIGRRKACDVMIDTPDVSLAHALIFAVDGRTAIFDVGSRSGTYVNDRRVMLGWLNNGAELRIGGECLRLSWSDAGGVRPAAGDRTALEDGIQQTGRKAMSARAQRHTYLDRGAAGSVETMSELDELLHTVQVNFVTMRNDLDERAAAIEKCEAEQEANAAANEKLLSQLEAERTALDRRTSELDRQQSAVVQRERAIELASADIQHKRTAMKRYRGRLKAIAGLLRGRRDELRSEWKRLEADRADHEREAEALAKQRAECDQTAARQAAVQHELHERHKQLSAVQAELTQRESRSREMDQKIHHLRSALRQANDALGSPESNPDAEPEGPPGERAEPPVRRKPNGNGGAPRAAHGAPDASRAPLVDQPLFPPLDPEGAQTKPDQHAGDETREPNEPPNAAQSSDARPRRKRRWWA